jgi:hypothetical protein
MTQVFRLRIYSRFFKEFEPMLKTKSMLKPKPLLAKIRIVASFATRLVDSNE